MLFFYFTHILSLMFKYFLMSFICMNEMVLRKMARERKLLSLRSLIHYIISISELTVCTVNVGVAYLNVQLYKATQ